MTFSERLKELAKQLEFHEEKTRANHDYWYELSQKHASDLREAIRALSEIYEDTGNARAKQALYSFSNNNKIGDDNTLCTMCPVEK